jgi:hypothetical protein
MSTDRYLDENFWYRKGGIIMVAQEQVHEETTERTRIEDLTVSGEELSEEALRLIAGGMRSAGTCSSTAACDDD